MAKRKINAVISRDVPIPSKSVYPFEDMAVGDCMFVPGSDFETPKEHWRVSSAARYNGLRLGFKFTVRMMDDGVRVWRIS